MKQTRSTTKQDFSGEALSKTKHRGLTSLAFMELVPGADRVVRHICIRCIDRSIFSVKDSFMQNLNYVSLSLGHEVLICLFLSVCVFVQLYWNSTIKGDLYKGVRN